MVGHVTQKYLHPQVSPQCKQQLKGIAADRSAVKQNDPKYPKMIFWKTTLRDLPEVIAPCVNPDINLLHFTLKMRAGECCWECHGMSWDF